MLLDFSTNHQQYFSATHKQLLFHLHLFPHMEENNIPIMKKYYNTNPKVITIYFKEGRSSLSEGTA